MAIEYNPGVRTFQYDRTFVKENENETIHRVCIGGPALYRGRCSRTGQRQGKGQGKGDPTQVKENAPKPAEVREDTQAATETVEKHVAKDKAAKGPAPDPTASKQKQGGPKGKDAATAPQALEEGKALGKGHAKQGQALRKQIQHEDAKHMARHARLVRIRELAAQKGDAEMVARVEKLMEKEQQVYSRKLGRLQEQPRAAEQLPVGVQPGAAPEAQPDPDKGPQNAPDAQKEPNRRGPSRRND